MSQDEVVPIDGIDESAVEELFSLFCTTFHASREGFISDLRQKDYLLRLRDGGKLQAFSTLKLIYPEPGVRLIYSGDTLAAETARLGHRLPARWAQFVFKELTPELATEDFWLLLCSGYRTYRILDTFFHRYEPAPQSDLDLRERLDRWAEKLFDWRYQAGVVRPLFATPLLAPEPPARFRRDPHVRFFESANPDYRLGVELACLIPLQQSNLKPTGQRLVMAADR